MPIIVTIPSVAKTMGVAPKALSNKATEMEILSEQEIKEASESTSH
jgi:hypothetical protein